MTLPSSTMANSLPTFFAVAEPKRLAPAESKRNVTTGSLVRPSVDGWESIRVSPETMTRLRIRYMRDWPLGPTSSDGSSRDPGGTLPAIAASTELRLSIR